MSYGLFFKGFVSAALMNMWLTIRFGFGIVSRKSTDGIPFVLNIVNLIPVLQTITLGAACQAIAYCVQTTKPPFALMAISYAIKGFGQGLQDTQANGLVALLPTSPNSKMSLMHAIYGLGAFVSPLVATQFSNMKDAWSYHFLTSLGVTLITLVVLIAVSRFKTQEGEISF